MTTHQKHHADQAKETTQKRHTARPISQGPVALTPQDDLAVLQRTIADPCRARPADILALQRTVGNQAVTRLIQAKLMVGPAGDRYEQEADRVAEQVMTMPVPLSGERGARSGQQPVRRQAPEEEEVQTKLLAASITPLVQCQAEEEEELQTKPLVQRQAEEEEEEVQAKPLVQRQAEEEEEEVQTKPLVQRRADGSFEAGPSLESRLAAHKGSGSPLPEDVCAFMEPRFGADFSGVRVHADGEAAQLNRELSAQAFTHRQDIYLGAGRYDPGSSAGKRLLAHELTHVVQQSGSKLPAASSVESIQRAIGFEFETTWGVKARTQPSPNLTEPQLTIPEELGQQDRPGLKNLGKGDVIATGTRFEMQADVEPAGSDIEFVTTQPPFDATPQEMGALQKTMSEMVALCKKIESLSKKYRNKMFSAQYLGGDANVLINPGPIPIMGNAQVTGGLTLERLPALMKDLGYDKTSGVARSQGSEKLMGLAGENEAKILYDATRGAKAACDSLHQEDPKRGGDALQGLLTLILSYLLMGDRAEQVMSYAKHIAPIMARTDLGSLVESLPGPDRIPFQQNRFNWVRFVLDAAGMSGTAGNPVYKLGFKLDEKDPPTISHGPTRGTWLRKLAEGVDIMTDPRGVKKEEAVYEGMGRLGRKTEPVGPETPISGVPGAMQRQVGAIFELRRITKNIVYANWPAFTESIFEYFEELNDPSVQTPQYTGANIWGKARK